MNVLTLLACLTICSCALGVLGLVRIGKPRRGLKSLERACLLDPLSLPPLPRSHDASDLHTPSPLLVSLRQQAKAVKDITGVGDAANTVASAGATLLLTLISPLLAPLTGVEQATTSEPAGQADTAPPSLSPGHAILRFLAAQPLVQAALRISGLSLLMANPHERAVPTVMTADAHSGSSSTNAAIQQHSKPKPLDTHALEPTRSNDDDADDDDSERDATSDEDGEVDMFEDPIAMDATNKADAQCALFDGLQFYTVLSQVGVATVRSVVRQAMVNTAESMARERASAKQRASISAIEQRYPDILCLSAPAYAQPATRTDLATALLAVTAAAAMQQQQQQRSSQQRMACSSMERRLSTKRPESLALAAEDGMEPARRTPLTSPSATTTSASQLEPSYLQAA